MYSKQNRSPALFSYPGRMHTMSKMPLFHGAPRQALVEGNIWQERTAQEMFQHLLQQPPVIVPDVNEDEVLE